MSSASLSQRIQSLSESCKATLALIQELQKFPNGITQLDDLDEQRLELANTCHQNLKDVEENLESLRQDIESLDTPASRRRAVSNTTKNNELEHNTTAIAKLAEDVKTARGAFRRAQLQSKKNLDARKQKEREQLFANRRSGIANDSTVVAGRQKGREKLTQDELNQNAAEDVTRALRRTHELMSSNLKQSQFAQQALEESQEQLKTLGDQYSGTTEILQKSRGLVKTLVTSQKSDTWYLQTSVYILIATISWLVFRRLLYGPLWWLVFLPLKWVWWGVMLPFRGAGTGSALVKNSTVIAGSSRGVHNSPAKVKWATDKIQSNTPEWTDSGEHDEHLSPEMIEKMKRMIKDAEHGKPVPVESGPTKNTKKRIMELEQEQIRLRDEL